ncbi:hypothetical protein BV25DRAFT_1819531 [Artomyces pyxidatus]|uniref:Uncharacterized protein n=1 Tax=Artomyces pyxidatus TaxID=48021 RepID=A0ACB8TFP7_9AGAM|nr:hypothetical protein BV25DRAFT_1819531 [Artomyces pyxidatus]
MQSYQGSSIPWHNPQQSGVNYGQEYGPENPQMSSAYATFPDHSHLPPAYNQQNSNMNGQLSVSRSASYETSGGGYSSAPMSMPEPHSRSTMPMPMPSAPGSQAHTPYSDVPVFSAPIVYEEPVSLTTQDWQGGAVQQIYTQGPVTATSHQGPESYAPRPRGEGQKPAQGFLKFKSKFSKSSSQSQPVSNPSHGTGTVLTQPNAAVPMCRYPGCRSTTYYDTHAQEQSEYCGDAHKQDAVRYRHVPPCVFCHVLPRRYDGVYCGRLCMQQAAAVGRR